MRCGAAVERHVRMKGSEAVHSTGQCNTPPCYPAAMAMTIARAAAAAAAAAAMAMAMAAQHGMADGPRGILVGKAQRVRVTHTELVSE